MHVEAEKSTSLLIMMVNVDKKTRQAIRSYLTMHRYSFRLGARVDTISLYNSTYF